MTTLKSMLKEVIVVLSIVAALTGCSSTGAVSTKMLNPQSIATGNTTSGTAMASHDVTRSASNVTGLNNDANIKTSAVGKDTESVSNVSGEGNKAFVDSIALADKASRVRKDEILDANSPKSLTSGTAEGGPESAAEAEIISDKDGTSIRATAKKSGLASINTNDQEVLVRKMEWKTWDLTKVQGVNFQVMTKLKDYASRNPHKNVHFHLAPLFSNKEGGHVDWNQVEMTVPLPPMTVIFDNTQDRRNFFFTVGHIALSDTGLISAGIKDKAALDKYIIGWAVDKEGQKYVVLEGYFNHNSPFLRETSLGAQPITEAVASPPPPELHRLPPPGESYVKHPKAFQGGKSSWVPVKNH